MNLTEFIGNRNLSDEFINRIKERTFLKTELDVIYTDFTNWERGDLLFIEEKIEKGKWKHLNFREYVWIKIVEQLRKYGFTYKEIKLYKEEFLEFVPAKKMVEGALANKQELDEINTDIYPALLENKNNSELLKTLGKSITYLDFIIAGSITYNQHTSIHFFKGKHGDYTINSKKIIEEYDNSGILEELNKKNAQTHLSVSISSILSQFITEDKQLFLKESPNFLNEKEYKLLKVIRNKPNDLRKISVRFKEQEMELIEIESLKKIELESRLMEHIQKGDYTTMEITAQDGHISYVKNTKRIKL